MDIPLEGRAGMSIHSGKEDSEIDDVEIEGRGDKLSSKDSASTSQFRLENSGYFTRSKGRVPQRSDMPNKSPDELAAHLIEGQQKMVEEMKYGFQCLGQEIANVLKNAVHQPTSVATSRSKQIGTRGEKSNLSDQFGSRPIAVESSSSDESDDQTSQADEIREANQSFTRNVNLENRNYRSYKACRLPAFTGKESWKTWFGRFEEVARRRRWSDDDKLDELLPRLQGAAGEFVFNQLLPRTRANYSKLTDELNCRFQVIELPKTFRSRLAKRAQKFGESVEDYAADLKRLYDKAFPERSHKVRQEDLLRYFLDGLSDDQARQQVEFVKEPASIDEAIIEVVTFQESKRKADGERSVPDKSKRSRPVNMVRPADDDDGDDDDESESEGSAEARIARMNTRPGNREKNYKLVNRQSFTSSNVGEDKESIAKLQETLNQIKNDMVTSRQFLELQGEVKDLASRVTAIEDKMNSRANYRSRAKRASQPGSDPQVTNQTTNSASRFSCFTCGSPEHFARNCPNAPWLTGQMNLAVQPNSNFVGQGNFGPRPKDEAAIATGMSYSVSPTGQVNSQIQPPGGGSPSIQQMSNLQGSTL